MPEGNQESARTTETASTARSGLIAAFENAIANGSKERCTVILLHIIDLFTYGSKSLSENELELFDELFIPLSLISDGSLRLLLAETLARSAKAPRATTRMLAGDDDIKVAYPILVHSRRLDETALVQIAQTKGQAHLRAISRRELLAAAVTDVLVERGDRKVVASLLANPDAKFSHKGFDLLAHYSGDGLALAEDLKIKREYSSKELFFSFGGDGVALLAF